MVLVRAGITVDLPLLLKFKNNGFNVYKMKCRIIPYAANYTSDTEPVLKINKNKGFQIEGKIMIDL